MDSYFGQSFATIQTKFDDAKPFSRCGNCRRLMKLVDNAALIHCDMCQVDLRIPTNGHFKLIGEKYCPLDKYQVIFFTSSISPNVSFFVCPKCYTDSPLIEGEITSCSLCPK